MYSMTLSERMKSIDPTDNRISTKASQYIGRLDLQQMKEEEEVKAMKISLMSLQEEENQSEDMH